MQRWQQVFLLAILASFPVLYMYYFGTALRPPSLGSIKLPVIDAEPGGQVLTETGSSGPTGPPRPSWLPQGFRRVWFDIGTAGRCDFRRDLKEDRDLFLIAVEPTPSFADQVEAILLKNETRDRFHVVRAACTDFSPAKITFYVHPLQECNSLRRTRAGHSKVFNGECVGKTPKKMEVDAMTLADILEQLPLEVEIQLVKIDIQGHEWPCLEGAGEQLRRVQNIFLEIQDLPKKDAMYEGVLDVASMDQRLESKGFYRQYCEMNSPELREINCLYTQKGHRPLWVTGRPQKKKRLVLTDLHHKPPWKGVEYLGKLRTSPDKGQMHGQLCDHGLLKSKYCSG